MKTAESVTPKHPDKVCDRISDAILDACLEQDKNSRVAIETMGGHNIITVTGELTTEAYIDIPEIVKRIVGDKYGVQTNIVKQSKDIANGVDIGGAGDQGIMVGYACDENDEMIPQEMYLARKLCKFLYNKFPEDGKTQITLEDGKIKTVVASFCNVKSKELESNVLKWIENENISKNVILHINPAGDWTTGSFDADSGLTGRKLIVDNYGPQVEIGGGAFSGKDASKVDRSGAYMARKIAVDILKEEEANDVKVKIAYSIGVAEPVQVTAEVNKGFNNYFLEVKGYDLTPAGIIKLLKLKSPIFEKTAEWGAFGNNFDWDK